MAASAEGVILWGVSDLRDIADAFNAQSKSLSRIESDSTDSARSIEEISNTLAALAESIRPIEEMAENYADISRALQSVPEMVKALGTLTTEVMSLGSRLNRYVDSTAEQGGRIRARLSALESLAVDGKR